MKKYKIAREVREQILNRVKNEGVSVTDSAKDHGVNPGTVYEWLKEGAERSICRCIGTCRTWVRKAAHA